MTYPKCNANRRAIVEKERAELRALGKYQMLKHTYSPLEHGGGVKKSNRRISSNNSQEFSKTEVQAQAFKKLRLTATNPKPLNSIMEIKRNFETR